MMLIVLFCLSSLEIIQLDDDTNIDGKPVKSVQNTQSPMKTNEFAMPVTKAYTQPLDTVTDFQATHSEHHTPHVNYQTEEITVKDVTSKISCTSLSTIVLNSRDRYGMYGMQFFARLETHLTIGFSQKSRLKCIGTAVIMLYIC